MILILFVLGIIGLYIWSVYNRFVTTKTRITASIQEIGNQLKRQAELIPNLIESVRGYMKHEKSIFEDLTNARKSIVQAASKNDPKEMIEAHEGFRRKYGRFMALVESTPQIRASETVTKLMEELADTADKIMYSRRLLIDLTADYNIMIVTFPSNLVAKIFGFKSEEGLKMPEEGEFREVSLKERKTPKVSLD
jgi:LemA protein